MFRILRWLIENFGRPQPTQKTTYSKAVVRRSIQEQEKITKFCDLESLKFPSNYASGFYCITGSCSGMFTPSWSITSGIVGGFGRHNDRNEYEYEEEEEDER